eukprot:6492326-Amphidinium_carterae.1
MNVECPQGENEEPDKAPEQTDSHDVQEPKTEEFAHSTLPEEIPLITLSDAPVQLDKADEEKMNKLT